MVKIDTTTSAQKASLRRIAKAGKSSYGNFSVALGEVDTASEAAPVTSPVSTNSLFLLQEVDEREVARERGNKILNLLEQFRASLLTGDVETHSLMSLKSFVTSQRTLLSDPKLEAILEEIEQRANIELAKRGLI